jgi:hypothetical protein
MLLFMLPQVGGDGMQAIVVLLGVFLTHSPHFFDNWSLEHNRCLN